MLNRTNIVTLLHVCCKLLTSNVKFKCIILSAGNILSRSPGMNGVMSIRKKRVAKIYSFSNFLIEISSPLKKIAYEMWSCIIFHIYL